MVDVEGLPQERGPSSDEEKLPTAGPSPTLGDSILSLYLPDGPPSTAPNARDR